MHAAYGYTAHIVREIKRRDEHLRRPLNYCGFRNMLYDRIQQRQDVVGRLLPVSTHPSLFGRSEYGRKIQLFFRGIKTEHEVENHVLHFIGAAVWLVDLIDHHHRLQAHLYGFL